MTGLHRAALCGTALWAVAAAAGVPERRSGPALVPHPLVVVGGGEEDAARFGPQLEAGLARRDIRVVGQKCAREFVARRPAGSCGGEEACLAELARSCGGDRALYVTVYPYRPQMVFVGKLVRADGLLERSVSNGPRGVSGRRRSVRESRWSSARAYTSRRWTWNRRRRRRLRLPGQRWFNRRGWQLRREQSRHRAR